MSILRLTLVSAHPNISSTYVPAHGTHLSVTRRKPSNDEHGGAQVEASRRGNSNFAGGGMGMGGRGVVGDRWSQRVLWMCAIGSAVSLYFVAVERQAQNRARAVSEGFSALDGVAGGAGGGRAGEDV